MVTFRFIQAFEGNHADAFANEHTAGVDVKGATNIILGKGRGFTETEIHMNGIVRVHAAGDHDITAVFK